MVRPREEGVRRGALDDAAEIHDRDAVADMLHHADVMADEQIGEPKLALELHEQVDDLRLDRDVERSDGFVADDELRLHRERAGNADPLSLPARELVRVPLAIGWVETDPLHHAGHVRILLPARDEAMGHRRLADDVDDALARIERRHRILKDHLRREPGLVGFLAAKAAPLLPAPENIAVALRHDSGEDAPERRLSTAGLAHQPDDLARHDLEIDGIDRMDYLRLDVGPEQASELLGIVEVADEPLRNPDCFDERCHAAFLA